MVTAMRLAEACTTKKDKGVAQVAAAPILLFHNRRLRSMQRITPCV